jgi:hypothetical protein
MAQKLRHTCHGSKIASLFKVTERSAWTTCWLPRVTGPPVDPCPWLLAACSIPEEEVLRPVLNFAPRGKLYPPAVNFVHKGWSYPLGVKLSVVHPSILPNSRECTPL